MKRSLRRRRSNAGVLGLFVVLGCRAESGTEAAQARPVSPAATPVAAPQSAPAPPPVGVRPPSRAPDAPRIAAFGDVHGDLDATLAVLRLIGAIDGDARWAGGDLVVVQTGDELDRGDDERAILELLTRLQSEAELAGGAVYLLLGNHELMNALGDFRYVTPGGFADFEDVPVPEDAPSWVTSAPAPLRGRAAAFAPAGPYARVLAARNVVQVVGDTVFVHGGVLPAHAGRIDALNAEVSKALAGELDDPQAVLSAVMRPDSPAWSREFSESEPSAEACTALAESLRILAATRMVVGHTPQPGVTSACDGQVWRIDVGMARHYGGIPAAIVIEGGKVRVLSGQAD